MTLHDAQWRFTYMVGLLIQYAYELGYTLSMGDAYRDPRVPYGHKTSLHKKRLALDCNLFIDGVYQRDGAGHDRLHDYWDTLGGAKRIKRDMNHYAFPWEGMR